MAEAFARPESDVPARSLAELLQFLVERRVLSPIDQHFALTLAQLADTSSAVALAAAFASRAVQNGHVCVDLQRLTQGVLMDANDEPISGFELPPAERWIA